MLTVVQWKINIQIILIEVFFSANHDASFVKQSTLLNEYAQY